MEVPQKNSNNKISSSGTISIAEDVSGKLSLLLETNTCSLDKETCEKGISFNFKDICGKLKDQNAFYSSFLSNLHPKLECPLKAGNYTKDKSELDLSILGPLSIDGKSFVSNMRLISSDADKNTKKVAMCVRVETKITRVRVNSRALQLIMLSTTF